MTNALLLARRQAAIPRGPFHVAPIFAERAEGCRVWDVEGRELIDFCSGIGVVNVGHNHPRVVEAVKAQAEKLIHTCWHVLMYEPYVELAERLNELVPIAGPNQTVLFNSGAEAAENVVKIARAATGRHAVVSFERGFHGRTLLAMTLTGKVHPYTAGFGPFAPEVYRLPYEPFFGRRRRSDDEVEKECREALDHLFAYHIEPESIALVLAEPVLGEGGFLPAHPRAFSALASTCKEHGILFAVDEVQSGFGRCGALFAIERFDIEPDLIMMAKSLSGGLPLSAVTGRAELMGAPHAGGIGGTFGGNPLACAAALAVLDVMRDEKLPQRAQRIGARVMRSFEQLVSRYDFVGDARGLGAMCGLEIVDPKTGGADASRASRVVAKALDQGLLLMTASGNVIRTLMPLTIDDADLERALAILEAAVEDSDG
jgi:4-aminobutyrate aminotransferase/(S)-3-amino-2-methylpropionate transaminase